MKPDTHTYVDVRALADLKSRAQLSEREVSALRANVEQLASARDELADAQAELARLRPEIGTARSDLAVARAELEESTRIIRESRRSEEQLSANVEELTEALQNAQAGYWEASRDARSKSAALEECQKRAARLEEQVQRIRGSRAWKVISAYRRLARRLGWRSA